MPALSAGRATDCHQRKVKQTGRWIAYDVCFNVPHRQFVFTMPKPLRGIFRKRRKLLTLLFHEGRLVVVCDPVRSFAEVRRRSKRAAPSGLGRMRG